MISSLLGPGSPMQVETKKRPSLPPRWFIRCFWHGHRALLCVSGGRVGLWRPKPNKGGQCVSPPPDVAPAGRAA